MEKVEGPLPDKLSGDGATIAASATLVFLTFSFPGLADNVLSAAGTRITHVHILYEYV